MCILVRVNGVDINECSRSQNVYGSKATCRNTQGHYTCDCILGYRPLNGTHCRGRLILGRNSSIEKLEKNKHEIAHGKVGNWCQFSAELSLSSKHVQIPIDLYCSRIFDNENLKIITLHCQSAAKCRHMTYCIKIISCLWFFC